MTPKELKKRTAAQRGNGTASAAEAEGQSEKGFDYGQPEEGRGCEGSGKEIYRRRAGDPPQGKESVAQENKPARRAAPKPAAASQTATRGGEARGAKPAKAAPDALHEDREGEGPDQAREGRKSLPGPPEEARTAQERGA